MNVEQKSQWEFAGLGKGWTIRSMYSDLYLAMGKPTGDGIPIVASEFPVSWHVQNGDISGVVKSVTRRNHPARNSPTPHETSQPPRTKLTNPHEIHQSHRTKLVTHVGSITG